MFFKNQSLKHIIVDLDSIADRDDLFRALESCEGLFETVAFASDVGADQCRESVESETDENLHSTFHYFPEEETWLFGFSAASVSDHLSDRGISPLDCVVISKSLDNIESVRALPVGTIVHSKAQALKCGADVCIDDWPELKEVLTGEIAGHLAELYMGGTRLVVHAKAKGVIHAADHPDLAECKVYLGGRYFTTADASVKRHLYTARLLAAKRNPAVHAAFFRQVILSMLKHIKSKEGFSEPRVTYVPPKPSDATSRMKVFFSTFPDTELVPEELLTCIRDFPPQKTMSGRVQRRDNVRDAFELAEGVDVANATLVLFDDIATSFSTLNECTKVLMDAGAAHVVQAALGMTVSPAPGLVLTGVGCEECGTEMVIRFNNKNGNAFWACGDTEAFRSGEKHPALTYKKGVDKIREMERLVASADDEIDF